MSKLPLLEPLLGAGLALNLAYLNISIFAYLSNIARAVDEYFDCIDPNALTQCKETDWFGTLTRLSRVQILENNMLFFKEKGSRWIPAPGVWGALYNFLFYYRLAKIGALLFTAFTSILLFYSVEHAVYPNHWASPLFAIERIGLYITLSGFAVFWPMMCAMAGTWCRWQAVGLARYQLEKLPKKQQKEAEGNLSAVEQRLREIRGATGRAA